MEKKKMTKQEAIDLLKNRKVYVNGRSKDIQEKLFELGFEWPINGKEVIYEDCPFLYTSDTKRIQCGRDMVQFSKDKNTEISYDEILAIDVVEELKENDVVVSGYDEGEWIAVIKNGEVYNYQYKVLLFLKDPFGMEGVLGFDSMASAQTWTRTATEEEKQKLIDALKLSSDGRAKHILKEVFGIEDCPFKPFDKVLCRDSVSRKWRPDIFLWYEYNTEYPFICVKSSYTYCIPYECHEHLLGTTKNPEE